MLRNTSFTKILLSVAAAAVVSVAALGGTFANFTATPTSIANNSFATGVLTMSRSGSGAILSASGMKIGDTVNGSVTITNTGTLAGSYTLSGFSSASLGTFAANGDAHTFYFHVSLPSAGSDTADNAFQGLSTSESFTWSATQT